ncbi:hypothetical protein [Paraburkholderia strydomiana]|uniref:hypothetical protein n=1 Tax=Paraburkholderia strydomiana TaxID=1245417 RepID=UPI001BEBB435|nr:hypothetical protein [Paraburkholderia strydomiana]MBT2793906.1 hypothetical protein [Paraburkholderia strydomiana]
MQLDATPATAQVRARSTFSPNTEHMDGESAAAQGVRSLWNAFFPGLEETPKK